MKQEKTDIVQKDKQEILQRAGKDILRILLETSEAEIKSLIQLGFSGEPVLKAIHEEADECILKANEIETVTSENKEIEEIIRADMRSIIKKLDKFYKPFTDKGFAFHRAMTSVRNAEKEEIEKPYNRLKKLRGAHDAEQLRIYQEEQRKRELEAARERQRLEEKARREAEKFKKAGDEERAAEIENEVPFVPVVQEPEPDVKGTKEVWNHEIANLTLFLNALINRQMEGLGPESCIEIKPGAVNTWLRKHKIKEGFFHGLKVKVERLAK